MAEKKDDESAATAGEDVAALAVAGAASLVVASTTLSAPIAAALAVGVAAVPPFARRLFNKALRAKSTSNEQKAELWLDNVAALMDFGSKNDLDAFIEEHIDEPWAHDNVIAGAATILNDIDESAIPVLARLTAMHLRSKAPPDERMKRAAELIVQMNAADVAAMRDLIGRTKEKWPVGEPTQELALGGGGPVNHVAVPDVTLRRVGGETEKHITARWSRDHHDYHRAFWLLKRYGFATDNPGGYYGMSSGPHIAALKPDAVDYLAKLFV